MHSAVYSALQYIVLKTPLPAATMIPVGPFKLSTQPVQGSWKAGVTIDGLAMQTGISGNKSAINLSAKRLENV